MRRGSLIIADSDFIDCMANYEGLTAYGSGAGIYVVENSDDSSNSTLTATGCTFLRCKAPHSTSADGGAVALWGEDSNDQVVAVIEDCVFQECFADQGAGLYVSRFCEATVRRCLFKDNTAHKTGGATFRGGGDAAGSGELTRYEHCVFDGNKAGYDIDGNRSDQSVPEGGAVGIRIYPRAEFYNCTFLNNYVGSGGEADAIKNACIQGTGDSMNCDERRSTLVNCVFWNDAGVGNDVLIRAEDTVSPVDAWVDLLNNMWPSGQVLGVSAVETGTITITENPVNESYSPLLNSQARDGGYSDGGYPGVSVKDFNGNSYTDGAGVILPTHGTAPDIGAVQAFYRMRRSGLSIGPGVTR